MGDVGVQVPVHSSICVQVSVCSFIRQHLPWVSHERNVLLLQFCTGGFETLHMFSSWYEDVHVFG